MLKKIIDRLTSFLASLIGVLAACVAFSPILLSILGLAWIFFSPDSTKDTPPTTPADAWAKIQELQEEQQRIFDKYGITPDYDEYEAELDDWETADGPLDYEENYFDNPEYFFGDPEYYEEYLYEEYPEDDIIIEEELDDSFFDEPEEEPSYEYEEPVYDPEPTEPTPNYVTYVLNTNTGKFHYPSCPSVGQMSPKNRWDYTATREEVISMGYSPCQRCFP